MSGIWLFILGQKIRSTLYIQNSKMQDFIRHFFCKNFIYCNFAFGRYVATLLHFVLLQNEKNSSILFRIFFFDAAKSIVGYFFAQYFGPPEKKSGKLGFFSHHLFSNLKLLKFPSCGKRKLWGVHLHSIFKGLFCAF